MEAQWRSLISVAFFRGGGADLVRCFCYCTSVVYFHPIATTLIRLQSKRERGRRKEDGKEGGGWSSSNSKLQKREKNKKKQKKKRGRRRRRRRRRRRERAILFGLGGCRFFSVFLQPVTYTLKDPATPEYTVDTFQFK